MAAEIPASRPPLFASTCCLQGSVSSPVNRGSHGSAQCTSGASGDSPEKLEAPARVRERSSLRAGAGAWEAQSHRPREVGGAVEEPRPRPCPPAGWSRGGQTQRPTGPVCSSPIPHAPGFVAPAEPCGRMRALLPSPPPRPGSSGRGNRGRTISTHHPRYILWPLSAPPAAAQAEGGDSINRPQEVMKHWEILLFFKDEKGVEGSKKKQNFHFCI